MSSAMMIAVERASADFNYWGGLLDLLRSAFAYQELRIDPSSSVHTLDSEALAAKAAQEHLFVVTVAGEMAGSVFAAVRGPSIYVSKLAVRPRLQRQGIGRALMQAAETFARESVHTVLELETRIELIENHPAFQSLGFGKVEHAHAGDEHPIFIRMRRRFGGLRERIG